MVPTARAASAGDLVSVRSEAQALGWKVSYDAHDHQINMSSPRSQAAVWIGSTTGFRDAQRYHLAYSVRIIQDHAYMSRRDLLTLLGANTATSAHLQQASTAPQGWTAQGAGTAQPAWVTEQVRTAGLVQDRATAMRQLAQDSTKYMGIPYQWGGDNPSTGFDCSGFIWYLYHTHNLPLVRTTSQQLFAMGASVSRSQLQPGDLVFFALNQPGVVSHVGIYLGDNKWISATSSKGIWTYTLDNTYWAPHYLGARRI